MHQTPEVYSMTDKEEYDDEYADDDEIDEEENDRLEETAYMAKDKERWTHNKMVVADEHVSGTS